MAERTAPPPVVPEPDDPPVADRASQPFAGPGEMRARCRALDWGETPPGPVERWPPSLRTAAALVLGSSFPSILVWGAELVQLYNDAYASLIGHKHPAALGAPTHESWPEIRQQQEAIFERVFRGETVHLADAPYRIDRGGGSLDEAFFTATFVPVPLESGAVGGSLSTLFETTEQVRARELAADRARLLAENDEARARLGRVLAQTPAAVGVLLGRDHVVRSANEMFMRVLGRRDYIGRPAREVAPELVEQGFLALLDEVYRTGAPYEGREAALVWDRDGDGALHEGYFDFVYQPILDAAREVEGILVFAVEVTPQVRARQETERAARRTARLQTLTAALAGARTLDDVAAVVVSEVASDAATAMLVLRGREGGLHTDEARIVRQRGFAPDVVGTYGRFSIGTTTPGPGAEVLRTGEAVWLSGTDADTLAGRYPELGALWASLGVSAAAAVPLVVAGEVVGAMSFTFTEPRALAPAERDFFLALGRQAAQAVERARLFDAEHEARARVTTVLESISDAFYAVDAAFRFTYINRKTEELWGRRREELIGRHYWTEFPQAVGSESYRSHQVVMAERRALHFETVSPLLGRWIEVSLYPESGGGLSCYFRDIAERKAAEAERERLLESERAARADAEAANRAKSEFLAVMSHELRTPLNAIGGYAELLEMGIRGPVTEQQREDLSRIQSSQRHLLGLINEVLNYAKLETESVRYDLTDVRVRDALAAAEALVVPQARAKGITLDVGACAPSVQVRADAEKLRQILVNLLSNAVKFTDRGGRIQLACAALADRVRIAVRDTGIGIPPDKLEAIFEPFVQVRADLTRTAEGTGLGLAISRDLARGMGGELGVASRLGEGSVFALTLPTPPPDRAAGR